MSQICPILIIASFLVHLTCAYFCFGIPGDGDYSCSDGLSCCYCNNTDSGGCLNDGVGGCGAIPTFTSTLLGTAVVFGVSTVYSGTFGYAASIETQYYGSTDVVDFTIVQTAIVDVETMTVLAGTVAAPDVIVTARDAHALKLDSFLPIPRALVTRQDEYTCLSAWYVTLTNIQTITSISYVYLEASVGTVSTLLVEADATSINTDVVVDSQTSFATVSTMLTIPGSTRTVSTSDPSTLSSSPTITSKSTIESSTDDTDSSHSVGTSASAEQGVGGNSQASDGVAASPTGEASNTSNNNEDGSASPDGSNASLTTTSKHNGTNIGAIAGGVVGGILGLVAIFGALLLYWVWKKHQNHLWPVDEESKHDRRKKKKKKKKKKKSRKEGTTSILFIPGPCHTAFHLAPVLAAFERCGAHVELPDEDNCDDDESSKFMSSTDYTRSVAAAWKAALEDPRLKLNSIRYNQASTNPNREKTNAPTFSTVAQSKPFFDAKQYTVLPQPLYSASDSPREPRATFDLDVQHILDALISEAIAPGNRNQICVIAHGAAGIVAMEAMNRFYASAATTREQKAKLKHFVAVSAILSTRGVVEMQTGAEQGWMSINAPKGCMKFKNAVEFLYNDIPDEEDAKPFVQSLVTHYGLEVVWGLRNNLWRTVPWKTYFISGSDEILGVEYQVAEANLHGLEAIWLDGGHCAFISRPEKFVENVIRVLEERKRTSSLHHMRELLDGLEVARSNL